MAIASMPDLRPENPNFSCGPCSKRPGWSLEALSDATLGRNHRGAVPRAKLAEVIERSRDILGMPADWRLAIVPASDTGAVECAMWSLLGSRAVDVVAFEAFSKDWATDALTQLPIEARLVGAAYGDLPDLGSVDFTRDVVLTWNGTTSGVRIPDGGFIPDDRSGLVICDATSAAFAMDLPWPKLDVVTWSWQKVLGGEAAHGMLALSPRAVERLRTHTPPWPVPKVFRLATDGVVHEAVFRGETINTPSMLCVEDALDGLRWAEGIGGLHAMIDRSRRNFAQVEDWVARSDWAAFLARDPRVRSTTSLCLSIEAPWFLALDAADRSRASKRIAALLEAEGVAFDIASYRDAPPGLRIWGGATVEASDMALLMPWLDWAHAVTADEFARVAA